MSTWLHHALCNTFGIKRKPTSIKNPQKWMLFWSIFMIVTCYANLISMARISKTSAINVYLTDNTMDHLLYLPKTVLNASLVTATKCDTTCLIADWTTTGEQRQLLMIFTITAQCRLKGMITPSVVRTVWKQRYTPQKQKSGHHFIYLEDYVIQRQMNNNQGSMRNKLKRINIRRVKPFED